MASDTDTSIMELRDAVAEFVADRSWERFHSLKNLAMSITIEAAELMELFQWESAEQVSRFSDSAESTSRLAEEMADILIYCFALANRVDIDLTSAVRAKLSRNEERYPIGSRPSRAHPSGEEL